MLRTLALAVVVCALVGCGKDEQPVADIQRTGAPPAPPSKIKYEPQFGPSESHHRYTADKPFSGNNATLPENAPPTRNYVGTVRNVAGNSITISVNGQDLTFPVGQDIMISSGNNPRYFPVKDGLARVAPGNQVRISTVNKGAGEIVTFVLLTTGGDDGNNDNN